mgnify:CR=1 FL=1
MGYSAKQRKIKVGVLGVDKIKRTLKAMDEAACGVLEKGAQAGGEIALDYAKQNTPVDTGALRNSLKLTTDKVTKKKATVKIDYSLSSEEKALEIPSTERHFDHFLDTTAKSPA